MARCDEGYLCAVCGKPVSTLAESDLYLSYVIGEIAADALPSAPERHIRCNPVQAQFIVDEAFEPVFVDGPFDKRRLDPESVRQREALVTRGWRRLQQLATLDVGVDEYPLPEFQRPGRHATSEG